MSLMFNLKSIRGKTGQNIPFQMVTNTLPENRAGWQLNDDELRFTGVMMPQERTILLDGDIRGFVKNACGRCLKPVERDLNISFQEELLFKQDLEQVETTDTDEDIEEQYWIYDHLNYDFSDLVLDKVLAALPIAPLCDDDCAGLCSSCGQDLNKGTCECQKNEIDPRWAKLEKLKNNWEV